MQNEISDAISRIDAEGVDVGEPTELRWYPDRTWNGRTYVPFTAPTSTGAELYGYLSFEPEENGPAALVAWADFTEDTAERNPDWAIDISAEVVGLWRGERSERAEMTLIWGVPMIAGARTATAELSDLAVDQSPVLDDRFTMIAPDAYRSDFLEIKLWDSDGRVLATESLYAEEEDEDEAEETEPGVAPA